mgnify:CR=1 FL=1
MLCSTKELGLSGDASGIMHLPADSKIGEPVENILESNTIYEVEITPNRPDWLSHWGVARDLAALIDLKPRFPKFKIPTPKNNKTDDSIVTIKDFELCPRYTARIIRGVKIAERSGTREPLRKKILRIH